MRLKNQTLSLRFLKIPLKQGISRCWGRPTGCWTGRAQHALAQKKWLNDYEIRASRLSGTTRIGDAAATVNVR